MTKKEKQTKSVFLELDNDIRADIIEIQSRYVRTGVRKTIAQIVLDCLRIGIHNKLINTEKL